MDKVASLAKACKDLTLKEPFYGLFLMSLNKHWNEGIPTACVAMRKINAELHINTEFWNSKSPDVQMGILKHELLHIAFFHLTTFRHLLKENQRLANLAMDMEINQYIDTKMLWSDPAPILPSLYPELDLELKQGTKYYYDKLKDNISSPTLSEMLKAMANGDVSFQMGDGTEVELPNHDWKEMMDMDEATEKLMNAQMKNILNNVAEHVAKSKGNIPGEMVELLKRISTLEEPKFDWKCYMRRFAGKSVKVYTKKSRRKYNKRSPDFPGLKIKQQKHILAAIDTSGSVNTAELKEFLQEINHMHKTGSDVTICQCDTAIHKLEKFNPKEDLEIHGRGGTDFQPVIDYYNENHHKYSCLMYLTDGEAHTPHDAKGNILWVLSSQSNMNDKLPGAVIQLN